jgi:hypothetical protein
MDLTALRSIIGAAPLPDAAACRSELQHIRSGRGLLDAREVAVLARLDELAADSPSMLPEDELAKASKTSLGKAGRVRNRKKACDDIPELADALANGDTTGDRVDTFARAASGLTPEELDKVAAHGAQLAAAAANASDREFRQTIERIVARARHDDGLDRLARQRAATRLRWWTGPDGMWNLNGSFDPVRGTELEGRIRNAIEALFHSTTPDDAPADPFNRNDHLAALALHAIVSDTSSTGPGATGGGAPDVTVLIDATTLLHGYHDHTIIDAGLGRFGLPIETIRRWACIGTVTPVVTAADGTRLYLGRETRLANRAQRRALRVLYRTCALCDVPFEHTQIHHVAWYRLHFGRTDIDNLLPLCRTHHQLVHEGRWQLHLAADRTLTVTRPGGTTSTHGPPRTKAA